MILKVQDQIKFFKSSKKSLCKTCFNYNNDCSNAFKTCATDRDSGYSLVETCSSYNSELNKSYKGESISASKSESRTDMMGGGYQNMEKFNIEK